jgi:hypothetical protein
MRQRPSTSASSSCARLLPTRPEHLGEDGSLIAEQRRASDLEIDWQASRRSSRRLAGTIASAPSPTTRARSRSPSRCILLTGRRAAPRRPRMRWSRNCRSGHQREAAGRRFLSPRPDDTAAPARRNTRLLLPGLCQRQARPSEAAGVLGCPATTLR